MTPQEYRKERARSPLAVLLCRDEREEPHRPNLPEEDLAIDLFADLLAALEAVAERHDDATTDGYKCGCVLCEDVQGALWGLYMAEIAFTGSLLASPRKKRQAVAYLLARHQADADGAGACTCGGDDDEADAPALVAAGEGGAA